MRRYSAKETFSPVHPFMCHTHTVSISVLDGYCSTVQGLLDCLEEDLGFTKLLFTETDVCVVCIS